MRLINQNKHAHFTITQLQKSNYVSLWSNSSVSASVTAMWKGNGMYITLSLGKMDGRKLLLDCTNITTQFQVLCKTTVPVVVYFVRKTECLYKAAQY